VVVSERSRRLGREAADLAVAQAVADEREELAGDSDSGFVLAAPVGDAMEVALEPDPPW
jgi:hypothetical protein